ncbi:MAG TPA: hypothetical protein VFW50_24200 [Streptosporangiaceae bacterium]|nr:hypothetical protein [Streptosporangiaceae bacterium]
MTRATREHPDIRQGSSVRGAIDLTLVAGQLFALRGTAAEAYPIWSTTPWWSRCPGGSSWTRPWTRHRRRCCELARLGRGRLRRIGAYTDIAPALGAIFTD